MKRSLGIRRVALLAGLTWVVQNTKHHPFLIHADSVCTVCVFLPQARPETGS